jgi:hypothetical protein
MFLENASDGDEILRPIIEGKNVGS